MWVKTQVFSITFLKTHAGSLASLVVLSQVGQGSGAGRIGRAYGHFPSQCVPEQSEQSLELEGQEEEPFREGASERAPFPFSRLCCAELLAAGGGQADRGVAAASRWGARQERRDHGPALLLPLRQRRGQNL